MSHMSRSLASRASNASSQMLEQLANRSQTKIFRVQGSFNDQEMRVIWNALGLYISRNMRMGRGVNVPKLGVFTFTPPQVSLKGVTNQKIRDQRPRSPVFLIQKQFIKGVNLKSAIFYHQDFGLGLRPYTALGSTGDVPIAKMNLLQISSYANMSKDATELALNRIIKYIAERLLAGQNLSLQIPNVGNLISRNNLVAVKFSEFLHRDTRTILSKSVDQRKKKGEMKLTSDNLRKFAYLQEMNSKLGNAPQQFLEIDESARNFLHTSFGFRFDSNNVNRSTTNFDRTVASRDFDLRNRALKTSQMSRMTQSGFMTNKIRNFNKEYNIALRLIKQWVNENCKDSERSFDEFVKLTGRPNAEALNQDDVWNACKSISIDITEQQSSQLFRVLDCNKDGFVTKEDWSKNIKFDTNGILKSLINFIRSKNYKLTQILKKMGLEGVSKVSVYTLKQGLRKLNPSLKDDEAFYLSRYIAKGRSQITIQTILEVMNLGEASQNQAVDSEWQQRFLGRLKRKMMDKQVYEEELQSKFRFYDKNGTGYIEQTDLKNVLAQLGISLTLSQLIKVVKIFPINDKNHICYQALLDKLVPVDAATNNPISEKQFVQIVDQKLLNQKPFPFPLPISVRKLTSQLQSTLFKDQSQAHLHSLVQKIDVNNNGEVSQHDITAFKQKIRRTNKSSIANGKPSSKIQLENMVIKIRQKSIKKKISFHDIFKKLDQNNDGFISLDQWMKNLDQIFPFSNDEKEELFDFMDRSKIQMIDYKSFLNIMNGNASQPQLQKFDWVEQVIEKLKSWFQKSDLSLGDAFRVADSDGDSYLNEKDFSKFLIEKLKYQQRQLSHVRMQKFMKVLDGYKRGKIDFQDWTRVLKQGKIDWVRDAIQQIGLVMSRMYPSLSEAYTQITQGQKKFLFSSFQKWIRQNNVLSGFMINQQMIKNLFSQLDAHKKGYLLENDFVGHFGTYNWKSEQTKQFVESLQSKFKTCQQAFRCLSSYKPRELVTYNRFEQFCKQVFGQRFKKSDVKGIWKGIMGDKSTINQTQFMSIFSKYKGWSQEKNPIDSQYPRDDWKYQDHNIIKGTTIRSEQFKYEQREDMQEQCGMIVKNVKQILFTSPKTLEQVFLDVDREKKGMVTNLQFKQAFRKLNIALTSKQIDLLLNYCDFKQEGLINWKQFIKRFKVKQDKLRIINRITPKMQHLSDLLHYYMISPKDAYRKWNNPRTGYMSFEEFHKMLKELYPQASEPLPEFSVLKQFFDHIDIRRDGYLDFQEFTQTFRNYNPPSLLMGTTPIVPDKTKLGQTIKASPDTNQPIREHKIPLFKNSPQYQQFVRLIGRNRKYLQEKIEQQNPNKVQLLPFSIVESVIKSFANQHKVNVDKQMIRNFVAFSMTGDNVDYRLLFESFKERNEKIVQFPTRNFF